MPNVPPASKWLRSSDVSQQDTALERGHSLGNIWSGDRQKFISETDVIGRTGADNLRRRPQEGKIVKRVDMIY